MKITMVQGDDLRVFVSIDDMDGNPINMAGAQSIQWGLSSRFGAAPILTKSRADGDIIVTGAGALYFDITAAESGALAVGQYAQEIQIVTSGGLTYTVGQGSLAIKPQIIGA
jgi:hypothetical protein